MTSRKLKNFHKFLPKGNNNLKGDTISKAKRLNDKIGYMLHLANQKTQTVDWNTVAQFADDLVNLINLAT